MFLDLLFNLRAQGLAVGTGQWLAFLDGVRRGLATDLPGLYQLGRALLCRSETEYDGFDVAFAATFDGARLPEHLREKLAEWLEQAIVAEARERVASPYQTLEELWRAFEETLRAQKERHDGGNRWVGTGGTSPFGNSGFAQQGIRVGGEGGGRSAVGMAMERRWQQYRGDRVLDVRDLQVVLRALRSLAREGALELDLDETIDATAKNAGEIELIERRARKNRLKVVLLMDAGGSMAPHAERVEKLFTAAKRMKSFHSFQTYTFHNCVYGWLYTDISELQRKPTHEVLANLTDKHRLIFVGDASMAPYELFSAWGWPGEGHLAGIDWLRRFKERCPAAVWLNPDPRRYWNHPTVSGIGRIFPMFELTVDGLDQAVRKLRAPV